LQEFRSCRTAWSSLRFVDGIFSPGCGEYHRSAQSFVPSPVTPELLTPEQSVEVGVVWQGNAVSPGSGGASPYHLGLHRQHELEGGAEIGARCCP
jgi:hypothetical protein